MQRCPRNIHGGVAGREQARLNWQPTPGRHRLHQATYPHLTIIRAKSSEVASKDAGDHRECKARPKIKSAQPSRVVRAIRASPLAAARPPKLEGRVWPLARESPVRTG